MIEKICGIKNYHYICIVKYEYHMLNAALVIK